MDLNKSWVWLDFSGESAALEHLQAELLDSGCIGGEEHEIDGGTVLRLYWDNSAGAERVLAAADVACRLSHTKRIRVGEQEAEDWLAIWKTHYHPIRVSDRMWVCPEWAEIPPDEIDSSNDPIVLRIHPAMAFGTGDHPTTQMCLALLEEHVQPGDTVLDIGCGSGILSIAAAKLGAGAVRGIDIDAVAMENARKNLELNGSTDVIRLDVTGDAGGSTFQATHVVCNIITAGLVPLLPIITSSLSNGRAILSGVDVANREEVRAAIRATSLTILHERERENWCAFVCEHTRSLA